MAGTARQERKAGGPAPKSRGEPRRARAREGQKKYYLIVKEQVLYPGAGKGNGYQGGYQNVRNWPEQGRQLTQEGQGLITLLRVSLLNWRVCSSGPV